LGETRLVGKHNLENIASAVTTALSLKCNLKTIQNTLKNFKGLEHRLEFLGEKRGLRFYNDSVSTSPDATMAAIDAFSEKIALIIGGASKNLDYSELVNKILSTPTIQKLVLTGEEGSKIKLLLNKRGLNNIQILECSSKMTEIYNILEKHIRDEKVVLFSPGALSFDAYKNYADRGEQFKKYFLKF
jgi:UDP-N-acetylmuramoylalanine--D-glutamate ligase